MGFHLSVVLDARGDPVEVGAVSCQGFVSTVTEGGWLWCSGSSVCASGSDATINTSQVFMFFKQTKIPLIFTQF